MRLFIVPLAAFLLANSASLALARDPIVVRMDVAMVMRLTVPANTVVVGNPGIADVAIHDRQTLIITGKLVGATNLVVLDGKGKVIAEEMIHVERIQAGYVSIQRGSSRYTYACTPHCNPMIEVGDNQDHTSATSAQVKERNGLANDALGTAQ